MPLDQLRTLSVDVSGLLVAVHQGRESAPRIIFPRKRDGHTRISEQEAKVLLCQVLDRSRWYYSVETPTNETYIQTGKTPPRGRSDISIYATRDPKTKAANIELKAHGNISVEDFRKDFEKILRENVHALWFHTLESTNTGTLRNVFRKMLAAFEKLTTELAARTHTIVFAFCVLSRRELWLTSVTLQGDGSEQLERLRQVLDHARLHASAVSGGWSVHQLA